MARSAYVWEVGVPNGTRGGGSFAAGEEEGDAWRVPPAPGGWRHRYLSGVDFLRVLRRRRVLIAAVVLVTTGLTAAIVLSMPSLYTATATIVVDSQQANVLPGKRVLESMPDDQAAIETQIEILKSRALARRVVNDLMLAADREFTLDPDPMSAAYLMWRGRLWLRNALGDPPARPPSDASGTAEASAKSQSKAKLVPLGLQAPAWLNVGIPESWRRFWTERVKPALIEYLQDPAESYGPENLADLAVDRLRARMSAEQIGRSNVIVVQATSHDGEKAKKIVNRTAELFLEHQLDSRRATTAQAVEWLNGRVAELHKQVLEAERAAASYQHSKKLPSNRADDPTAVQIDRLNTQLALVRSDRVEAEARYQRLRSILRSGGGSEDGAKVVTSPLLADLRVQEAMLRRKVAELSTRYGSRHPEMVNAAAELSELRGRLAEEVERILADLANQVTVTRARETELAHTIAALREQTLKQGTITVELKDLERDAETRRQLYTAFLGRLREITDHQLIESPGASVGSYANEPRQPSFPKPKRVISVAVVGSLAFALMLAFLVEGLDIRVRTAEQLARLAELPTLAMIPKIAWRPGGRLVHHRIVDRPRSAFAEALRNVHLELRLLGMGRAPQVLVVTSALPGEGKTTVALGLAAAAASAGHRTALVDLDLHRPSLAAALGGRPVDPDLVQFLAGARPLDEIAVGDERLPNLSTFAVSRSPTDPRALVASPRMSDLLLQLRQRFDFIVLDTPPVLPVRDAKILAGLADAVLFVVQWGETKEDAVQSAIEVLGLPRKQLIGAVLNRVCLKSHAKASFGDSGQYYTRYRRYYGS